jgi:hypothetical protein
MNAVDDEIERQEIAGVDDDETSDLVDAADRLRQILRSVGDPA